uniref:Uncharacterized protein n=1 Tax=Rhizophora mucronata TaxID=61149 RepID=A0A2P2L5F8_RHIMU
MYSVYRQLVPVDHSLRFLKHVGVQLFGVSLGIIRKLLLLFQKKR